MPNLPPSDVAYRVLRLEQQLESYQRLHAQELEEFRRALAELKEQVLALAKKGMSNETGGETKGE